MSPARSPLPPLVLVTDRSVAASAGRTLPDALEAALDGAAEASEVAVLYREKDLDAAERLALGRSVAAVVRGPGASLVVSADTLLAAQLGAMGVHLASDQLVPDVPPGMLTGRSCHSVAAVAASACTADYVTLSPVAPSISKPGHGPSVSMADVARATSGSAVPLYALGGVAPGGAAPWIEAGAHGVAVCGAVLGATEPWRIVADLLAEVRAAIVGAGATEVP